MGENDSEIEKGFSNRLVVSALASSTLHHHHSTFFIQQSFFCQQFKGIFLGKIQESFIFQHEIFENHLLLDRHV
jgi:hypothetical protein